MNSSRKGEPTGAYVSTTGFQPRSFPRVTRLYLTAETVLVVLEKFLMRFVLVVSAPSTVPA